MGRMYRIPLCDRMGFVGRIVGICCRNFHHMELVVVGLQLVVKTREHVPVLFFKLKYFQIPPEKYQSRAIFRPQAENQYPDHADWER